MAVSPAAPLNSASQLCLLLCLPTVPPRPFPHMFPPHCAPQLCPMAVSHITPPLLVHMSLQSPSPCAYRAPTSEPITPPYPPVSLSCVPPVVLPSCAPNFVPQPCRPNEPPCPPALPLMSPK